MTSSELITTTIDLETRLLAADLDDGWAALRRGEGGISCLVIWNSATGRPHLFDENTLSEAADMLESSDCILSFNGCRFDIPVLEGVLGRQLSIKYHLDLLQLIWAHGKKKGNNLSDVAIRTLGIPKSGEGLLAPQLAEEGRWAELLDYCLHDVYLTRALFAFAQEHGGIIGVDGDLLPLSLPDWFREAQL